MQKKIFVFLNSSSENIVYNPFFPETEVNWDLPDFFPEDSIMKDADGNLVIQGQFDVVEENCELACERSGLEERYLVSFVPFSDVLEIVVGKEHRLGFACPADFFHCEIQPGIVESSFDSEKKEWILVGMEEGFAECRLSWGQEKLYSVKTSLNLRVVQMSGDADFETGSAASDAMESPKNVGQQAVADMANENQMAFDANSPVVSDPSRAPAALQTEANPNSLNEFSSPDFSKLPKNGVSSIPEIKGNAFVVVFKKGDPKPLAEQAVGVGKSLIVGRSSGSARLAVDIDLKPYLSPENVDLCSRNQLRIFLSQKRMYIKNIGTLNVLLDDGTVLEPEKGVFLYPGRSIEIAGELVLAIQEK